jgi:hypothetical protein
MKNCLVPARHSDHEVNTLDLVCCTASCQKTSTLRGKDKSCPGGRGPTPSTTCARRRQGCHNVGYYRSSANLGPGSCDVVLLLVVVGWWRLLRLVIGCSWWWLWWLFLVAALGGGWWGRFFPTCCSPGCPAAATRRWCLNRSRKLHKTLWLKAAQNAVSRNGLGREWAMNKCMKNCHDQRDCNFQNEDAESIEQSRWPCLGRTPPPLSSPPARASQARSPSELRGEPLPLGPPGKTRARKSALGDAGSQ